MDAPWALGTPAIGVLTGLHDAVNEAALENPYLSARVEAQRQQLFPPI
jgi:hypothetical protein